MSLSRKLASVLLVTAALLLVLGALVLPWWTGTLEGGRFEIDLRGMRMCMAGSCGDSKALAAADAGARTWAKIGTSTFAASLVAAFLLGLCALRVLRRQRTKVLHWLAGTLALFSGVLGVLFVWLHPDLGDWAPTYGLACTLAGAFLGSAMVSMPFWLKSR